ncbi:MAG: PAS domain S-box protein [Desulfobacterales bacterium]|nr:PAS domain S-box protein [Desulfobacterales bacterium]
MVGLIITVILVSTASFFFAHEMAQSKAKAHMDAKADEYISYLKEILILPVWNYDFETIEVIGQSYLQNDDIASIEIINGRGEKVVSEVKRDAIPRTNRFTRLTHHGLNVGSVEISLSAGYYNIWNRQFFFYFGFIILINFIALIIMSGILLRWSLKKPLNLLNNIVETYNSKSREFNPVDMPYTEFIPLINTLQDMGNEINLQMGALQKAEKKYRSIFENAIEGIFQSTAEGRILNANPAFAKILGYRDPEELMTKVVDIGSQHYVVPAQREAYIKRLKNEEMIKSYEVQFRKKDGTIIWVSLNALPIYKSNGELKHIEGLVQDITKRKKVQNELTRLSTAVEQVAEHIVITDDKSRIKYVNPVFEKNTGYKLDELYNKYHRFLGTDESEKALYDEILTTVEKGDVWTGRISSSKKDGVLLIEDIIASPIKGPSERFIGYVSIKRDVTLKAKYETQLRQSQKMEAIGTLAGGIAHDFNNILGVIIGCGELVKKRVLGDKKTVQDIDQVLTAGLRAKSLVNQILTFSRREETRITPMALSPFVKEVIRFLQATLSKYIKIEYQQKIKSGFVLANPIQMQQILMNLCTNAAQAIGQKRGTIEVVLSERKFKENNALQPDIQPGPYIRIDVKDDGPGINPKIQHKIFDPFFTTKGVGEGTGLGLSVVHGIVKKHEGAIYVKSKEGQGACFSVLLPRIEHEDIKIKVESNLDLPQGSEKILLVDDEKNLLNILDRILRGLGYEVEAFTSSINAVKAFKERPDYFDLVLTDQVMADMTGIALSKEIRKKNTEIPIILFTGFNNPLEEKSINDAEIVDKVLKKPLMHAELAFAVRKVLDEKQST